MVRTLLVLAGAAVVVVVALAACSNQPGSLVADRRVSIEHPRPGSTVTEPVELRWTSRFEPGAASGLWFVVHLDSSMIPPGQSVLPFADGACDTVPACIEQGLIDGPNVFVTDQLHVSPGSIPGGNGTEHRFTVILVDTHGIRQGDVGWSASFRIEPG